ncbi:hypothetical protein LEP1GSC163_0274 [Leptospira santarosai str. CBC379]|uniref:Uncharacterized protein n=1 Tax=Leptospira santarosai str. MOR084 TaxID=1049984 RepID=A0A0E2BAM6_9LEPT|nr:hypothetical protein LEP1GSC179_0299 [Leptospira santarosai str. MOR084]EKR89873.1 hypothetical protein LEP1GSC163_0274 [Leptospira santarosai str. CBC379]
MNFSFDGRKTKVSRKHSIRKTFSDFLPKNERSTLDGIL